MMMMMMMMMMMIMMMMMMMMMMGLSLSPLRYSPSRQSPYLLPLVTFYDMQENAVVQFYSPEGKMRSDVLRCDTNTIQYNTDMI